MNIKQEIKKIIQEEVSLLQESGWNEDETEYTWDSGYKPERRFRCSIYVDVVVPETNNLETDRAAALAKAEMYSEKIPNSYVGGAGAWDTGSLEFDKEI